MEIPFHLRSKKEGVEEKSSTNEPYIIRHEVSTYRGEPSTSLVSDHSSSLVSPIKDHSVASISRPSVQSTLVTAGVEHQERKRVFFSRNH